MNAPNLDYRLLRKAVKMDTDDYVVVGLYDKNDFEHLIAEGISDEVFQDFRRWFEHGDPVFNPDTIVDLWNQWKAENPIADKDVEGWEERWHRRGSMTRKADVDIEASLQKRFNNQVTDFQDAGDGRGTFKVGEVELEWIVNEDRAVEMAEERVREDLDDSPENFNQDWLLSQIDDEQAESFFRDIYDEWNMGYVNDIESERSRKYTNRLAEEMVERGIITEEEGKDDNFDLESKKEEFVEQMTQEQIDEGGGGYEHYKDNIGADEASKLIIENNLIDTTSAAENAVSEDGWAHFLSGYDGEYDETPEGVVFFGQDGKIPDISNMPKPEDEVSQWEERWHRRGNAVSTLEVTGVEVL